MSGHSKWATTKRAKAVVDAKRGAIFTKLANLITVSAREKGGDPSVNFALRMAMDKARMANMPKDNIDRAIKKGTGESAGAVAIEELYYEGIGPANSQFIVKCLTDSKNRSAANVRHVFGKFGGSLGSVMWNFERKGIVAVNSESMGKNANDDFELELIDAGAEDIIKEEEGWTMQTAVEDLQNATKFLEDRGMTVESSEIGYVAKEKIELSEVDREKVDNFIEALDDLEDVADYYYNF